jgi:hypothetical protein
VNPVLSFLGGLVAGLLFGLMVVWGYLMGWYLVIGVGVILVGVFAPTPLRVFFLFTMLWFMMAFILGGGLEVMGV